MRYNIIPFRFHNTRHNIFCNSLLNIYFNSTALSAEAKAQVGLVGYFKNVSSAFHFFPLSAKLLYSLLI